MSQLSPRKYLIRFLQRVREAALFTTIQVAARTRKEFSDACVYTAPVCFRYSVCVDLRSVFLSRLSVDPVSHFRTPLARLPGQASPPFERHRYLQALDMASVSAQSQAASATLQRGIVKMVGETLPFECVRLLCVLCRGTAN